MTKIKTPVGDIEPVKDNDIETFGDTSGVSEQTNQDEPSAADTPVPPVPPDPSDTQTQDMDDGFVPPLKERAKIVFESHSVNVLYFTSDGSCFIEIYNAQAHAGNLVDGQIITIKREEV
jgi:hypothetical protein